MNKKDILNQSIHTSPKILFILSFYSALQNSIENDIWKPEGMPAVNKLFERLYDKEINFDVIFTENKSKRKLVRGVRNNKFNNTFYIYSLNIKHKFYLKILNIVTILKFIIFIKSFIRKNKSTLIYVDRSNFLIAAILSFLGYKVSLRFHGVSNFYSNYKSLKFKLLNPLNFFGLWAPFKIILSSDDGSPAHFFLKKFRQSSKKFILKNGVDNFMHQNTDKIFKNNFLTLIFVGRFSSDKGIIEFMKTLIKLNENLINVNSIIIGDGPLKNKVDSIIKDYNLKNVHLTGQIDHSKIYSYLKIADIYISLNKIGNMSNTVLEAFNSKKCIAVLDECKKTKRDITTKTFFKDNLIYIRRDDIVDDLFKKIIMLNRPKNFIKYQNRVINSKIKILDWKTRIDNEINLLIKYSS